MFYSDKQPKTKCKNNNMLTDYAKLLCNTLWLNETVIVQGEKTYISKIKILKKNIG